MNKLFVYGSLKRGFHNAHYLHGALYLGDFVTPASYAMYDFGDYPGVCQSGSSAIAGEVYQINPQHLDAIDDLEWYPDFYQRIVLATDYGDAWMYVVEPALCQGQKKITGNWREI